MNKKFSLLVLISALCLVGCKTDTVNSFSFEKDEVTVEATKYAQLVLNVKPANSEAWIEWSSSNENVVVLAGGSSSMFVRSIQGVNAGTAVITAKVRGDVTKSTQCTVKVFEVAATDIKFSCSKEDSTYIAGDAIKMTAGKSMTLKATVLPDNASFKTVTWTSSNDTVATINERGIIEANKVGTAVITATDYLGQVKKSINLTVEAIPVQSIFVMASEEWKKLEGEKKYCITNAYAILPTIATNKNVTVTSSDLKVVKVLSADTILTVAPGEAAITITTEDGGKTGTLNVKVIETALNGFKIAVDTIWMNVGEKYNIPCVFTPANATNKDVTGTSDAPAVVEVIDANTIKAVAAGKAKVELTCGTFKASVVVVVKKAVESITCTEDTKTIKVGEEYEIAYTILPADATNKNVKVTIADDSILQLVSGTKVKALSEGKTTVTLTTEDGNKSDNIIIKVEKAD